MLAIGTSNDERCEVISTAVFKATHAQVSMDDGAEKADATAAELPS